MRVASHKFVISMIHPKVLVVSNIYKTMITTPAIRVYDNINIPYMSKLWEREQIQIKKVYSTVPYMVYILYMYKYQRPFDLMVLSSKEKLRRTVGRIGRYLYSGKITS